MNNLASGKTVKQIIAAHGFTFNKNLGQNFLIDANVLENIVEAAGVDEHTGVIEIGSGAGVLTQALAQRAGKVVSIELDKRLIPILQATLKEYENVQIIQGDALKIDMHKIIKDAFEGLSVKVIANLPYYITTPIIMGLLENKMNIESIVVMIQKEVAERMVAAPGTKDYGALSVAVQYFTSPSMVSIVSPHCFIPQPKVASAVIKLQRLKEPPVKVQSEKYFFSTVKAAFGQRRKTLLNALANAGVFGKTKEQIKQILENIDIKENQRGETLSMQEFAKLSNALYQKK